VLFDKTGTLTRGTFEVTKIESLDGEYNQEKIISLAAALEQSSEHPIAKSILTKAREMDIKTIDSPEELTAIKGKGIEGKINGKHITVVSPGYLKEKGIAPPDKLKEDAGVTRVFLLVEGELAGSIGLSDTIRPESYQAVKTLKKSGKKCYMITGDNMATAKAVSYELGLDGYFAEVLPDQKQEKVKDLQEQGEYLAMTGDGVNDAPAPAQAQVGIAIGSGTDITAETADIILVNSNPQDVSSLIIFGQATYRKMVQNLLWTTGYNVIAIPLAEGVLYNAGILISPALGALFMSLSTVVVAINARLLKIRR